MWDNSVETVPRFERKRGFFFCKKAMPDPNRKPVFRVHLEENIVKDEIKAETPFPLGDKNDNIQSPHLPDRVWNSTLFT